MLYEHGIFQCVIISPAGRLLDCRTSSVVLPAHDGKVGILYNHMPMFCELGLGIIQIRCAYTDADRPADDELMLIDGGIAMVNSNLLKVIVYDALYLKGLETGEAKHMIEMTRKKLIDDMDGSQHREHNIRKLSLLDQLAQKSIYSVKRPAQAEPAEIFIPE